MAEKTKGNIKIWTATNDSQAGFMVTPRNVVMAANRTSFIAASPNGVLLAGKSIVFNVPSEDIRQGGLFVQTNDMVKMIPTTEYHGSYPDYDQPID